MLGLTALLDDAFTDRSARISAGAKLVSEVRAGGEFVVAQAPKAWWETTVFRLNSLKN